MIMFLIQEYITLIPFLALLFLAVMLFAKAFELLCRDVFSASKSSAENQIHLQSTCKNACVWVRQCSQNQRKLNE